VRNTIYIILITSFSIILTDTAFTYFYKLTNKHLLLTTSKNHRKKSPIFHHSLSKCSYGLADLWGGSRSAYITNSLGFRDQSNRNIKLDPAQKRILFIGDSFTEGVGVTYENSFVGMIDNNKNIDSQVLNAGVASYSPIIYWRKVKHLIEDVQLKFDHLVVYIDLSDIHDEAVNYKLSSAGNVVDQSSDGKNNYTSSELLNADCNNHENFSLKTFLWKYTTLSYFLYDYKFQLKQFEKVKKKKEVGKLYGPKTEKEILKNVLHLERAAWTLSDRLMQQFGESGLKSSEYYMDKLAELLGKHDIQLTIAVYPWPTQIWYDDINSIQVKFWQNWAKNNDANFINHFPDFVITNDKEKKVAVIKENYIWGDSHFNAKGHKLIAERLMQHLQ